MKKKALLIYCIACFNIVIAQQKESYVCIDKKNTYDVILKNSCLKNIPILNKQTNTINYFDFNYQHNLGAIFFKNRIKKHTDIVKEMMLLLLLKNNFDENALSATRITITFLMKNFINDSSN